MQIDAIPLRKRRALIIDPASVSRWHLLTNSYVQAMLAGSGIASDRFHIDIHQFSSSPERYMSAMADLLATHGDNYDFIFTVNRIPANMGLIKYQEEERLLFQFSKVPIVSWLVDNIGHHTEFMTDYPFENEAFLIVDESSIASGRELGHDLTFMPMWGSIRPDDLPDIEARPIPILFSGDIWTYEPISELRARLSKGDWVLGRIVDRIVQAMIDDKGTKDALAVAMGECAASDRSNRDAVDLFTEIDPWLRRRRRKGLLQRIKRLPVKVAGVIEDPELAAQGNIEALGSLPSDQTLGVAYQSKIMLGEFANFVDGVELRPSMAFAAGSVFACEPNRYFKKTIAPDMYIDLSDESVPCDDVLEQYLADPARMREMDRKAGKLYKALRTAPMKIGHPAE